MLSISLILILISVSIDCQKWCPLIETNGTYSGLGIYHRFRNYEGEADFVMFNRAGDEWLFDVIYNGSDKYDIDLLYNTVKHIESNKRIVYGFGLYRNVWDLVGFPVRTLLDCSVTQRVIVCMIFSAIPRRI